MISSRAEFYNRQIWSHEYATRYKYQNLKEQQDLSLKTIQQMSDDLEKLQRQRAKLQDITVSKIQMSNYLSDQKKLKMKGAPVPEVRNDSRIFFDKSRARPVTSYKPESSHLKIDKKVFLTETYTQNPLLNVRNFQRPLTHREKIQDINRKGSLVESGMLDSLFNYNKADNSKKLEHEWKKQQEKLNTDDVVQKVLQKTMELKMSMRSSGLGLSKAFVGDDF
ncbi:hypothetical protein SS50377_20898 [Spironucleus salmonicida]|uniref:Uncharacterized protein n=1 Tax=Spironucleus salmonicida TaxID=348837 RepID=V6LGY9_9EUKA|nr:hypothetical protein SS50377_20898 [Spironucleus salmonicida]|eukprot:EST43573.1 Hypothetical protein SS50377_16613 [Spironucleus salmonicida]